MPLAKLKQPEDEYDNFELFEAVLKNTQLSLIELKESCQRICPVKIQQYFVGNSFSRKPFLHLCRQTIEKSTRGIKRIIAYLKK
ncbi:MAG: hypothetical protein ACTMUB_04775 [cyanobacterium endosymbiont of Rhopalodia musculus]